MSRPSYPKGIGGIAMKTSSVSRATSASRSADSHARTNLATIASSAGEPAPGGGWWPAAGCCRRWRLARARLRVLLADSRVTSSMPATSLARKPRTSRKMRTAPVEAPAGGDLVQPGAQRGAFLAEPADALPGGQHRLLDGVLGVGEGAEHPVAMHLQLPPVGLGELPERLGISFP